jgi:transglutaminase superfamily protein
MSGAYLRLLVTVALAQVTVGLALRMMPPAALRSRIARFRSFAQSLVADTSPQDVIRAIEAAGRRLPPISTCLVRAFVAELLLGSPARPLRLTIGVKQTPDGLLESHAWVTDRDSVLIGAPCAGFVPIVEWSTV